MRYLVAPFLVRSEVFITTSYRRSNHPRARYFIADHKPRIDTKWNLRAVAEYELAWADKATGCVHGGSAIDLILIITNVRNLVDASLAHTFPLYYKYG